MAETVELLNGQIRRQNWMQLQWMIQSRGIHTNHTIILEVGHKKKLDQKCLNSPRTPMAVPPIPAKPLAERLVLGAWYMAVYDIGADRIIRLKSLCR